MNNIQKLGYILLGAGIMAIGVTIGQFITPNIEAQGNGVFDEITCRRLKVVDKLGKDAITLNAGEESNGMVIFDKTQAPAILLSGGWVRDEAKDNVIQIFGGTENNGILLSADETISLVKIVDNAGNNAIILGANETGNHAVVLGKAGKEEIGLWGDEEGYGAYIRDRAGNITWRAP